MEAHPITDYPYRWIPALGLSLFLVIAQTALLRCYTDTDWIPALIDGITTTGWFIVLSYLSWFIVGTVSMCRTNIITGVTVIFIMAGRKFHDLRHHGKNCRYAIHTICLYHTFSPFVRYPRLDSHTFMVSSPTGRKRTFGRGKLSHPRTRGDIHRRTSTR